MALKFALMSFLDVLVVAKFHLLIIASNCELASGIVELLTLEDNFSFALLHMSLYFALGEVYLADEALDHDLIVEFHKDSVGALNI